MFDSLNKTISKWKTIKKRRCRPSSQDERDAVTTETDPSVTFPQAGFNAGSVQAAVCDQTLTRTRGASSSHLQSCSLVAIMAAADGSLHDALCRSSLVQIQ